MLKPVFQLKYKLQESLKFRSFYGYCNVLYLIKSLRAPHINWKPLAPEVPRFVSIAREADIPLLAYSLKSLMQQVDSRPNFWLVGDSDTAYTKLQDWFSGCPSDVTLWHWQTLLEELDPSYQEFIKTWATSGKWGGYAKKFAITLAANAHSDILLFDADVLWFGDFPHTLQFIRQNTPTILAGKDYAQAYDIEVAKFLGEFRILEDEPLNCGLVYYPHRVLLETLTPDKITSLLSYAQTATTHFEQTLIAYAFWQSGGNWFSPDTVATTMSDNFRLRKSVHSLARHYAGSKHLFWRDA